MARVAVALSCTAQVMAELERLSRSRSGEVRMAERARIVLACLRGKRNDEIADEMGLRPNTVGQWRRRSEEHTSELQSLMRISYAVFCLKKKMKTNSKQQ